MTKDRITQLRQAWKHAQDELGRQYLWVTAGKECLDEIERLQKEIDDIRDEAQQMAGEIDLNT